MSKVTLEPLGNYVFVDMIDVGETISPGGIILPDAAKPKPSRAKIIAVGRGLINNFNGELIPMSVKVGDEVLINRYAGQPITDVPGYKELLLISEGDILSRVIVVDSDKESSGKDLLGGSKDD